MRGSDCQGEEITWWSSLGGVVVCRGGHGDKLGDNGSSFSVTGQVLWQRPLKPPFLNGCGAPCCGRFWGRWGDERWETAGTSVDSFVCVRACLDAHKGKTKGSKTKPSGNWFYPLSFCKQPGVLLKPMRKQERASGEGQQDRTTEDYSEQWAQQALLHPRHRLPGAQDTHPLPCWGMSSDRLSNELSSCSSRKIRPCAERLMLTPSPKQGKAARGLLQGIMLCGD